MKLHKLVFSNGEIGELRQLDSGAWACPICGEPWERFPPYWPNDGELGPVHSVSSSETGEVCPGCEIEFGVDEGVAPYALDGAQKKQWAQLRIKWLDKVEWNWSALEQLRNNLGIEDPRSLL